VVLSSLRHHLVWVLEATGQLVIVLGRRCVAGWTAAEAPLHRPFCRDFLKVYLNLEYSGNQSLSAPATSSCLPSNTVLL
jgi:hypothetical protein